MIHHNWKAANLIRALVVELEKLAAKAQEHVDHPAGRPNAARIEVLEERVDAIEEAVADLLATAENLEMVP